MAREKIKCPGCDCKVSLSEVEKNDGACPECGQQLFGITSKLFDNPEEDEDEDDELVYEDDEMDEDDEEYDDEEFDDEDEDDYDTEDEEDEDDDE